MLEEQARRNEILAVDMALVDIALGDLDRAEVRLKNASVNHRLEPIPAVPTYDPLRAPRFAKLFPLSRRKAHQPIPNAVGSACGQEFFKPARMRWGTTLRSDNTEINRLSDDCEY